MSTLSRLILPGAALAAALAGCFAPPGSSDDDDSSVATGPSSSVGGGGSTGSGMPPTTACTSQNYWDGGGGDEDDDKGPWMNPGRPCIQCHLEKEDKGPIVWLGGTVYPTLHEPNLCYGVDGNTSDAYVEITDADNQVFTLGLEATGNFSVPVKGNVVAFPIEAKVVSGGKVRAMSTPQMSGDCNGCHTEQGKNGAPGRIFLP